MSDEVLNIKVTATEIDLIMDALHAFEPDGSGWEGQDLHELADDLREQLHRQGDGWNTEPARFLVAEDDFIKRGMDAAEKAKTNKAAAASRAQDRRNFNMKRRDNRLSKTQTHDVWDANDPKNW